MFGSKLIALCLLIAYLGQTLGSLPAKCLLPKVVGRCRAAMPRFYFNSATNVCESFTYGGCGANENNFDTQEQCVTDCESAVTSVDPCTLPAQPGICMAYFPRFYYDQSEGTCKSFVYGGCQGNANNFVTEADCLSRCKPDICKLPKKVGPCKARKNRFYFNVRTGACQKFIYGGCQGNGNRFTTLAKCEAKCVPQPENDEDED